MLGAWEIIDYGVSKAKKGSLHLQQRHRGFWMDYLKVPMLRSRPPYFADAKRTHGLCINWHQLHKYAWGKGRRVEENKLFCHGNQ